MTPKNSQDLWYKVSTNVNEHDLNRLEELCKLTKKTKSVLIRYAIKEALFNAKNLNIPET